MPVTVECRKAITDRALELIPSASAEDLSKIADAITLLDKEDSVSLMLNYMDSMRKEEADALVQGHGQ